MKYIMIKDTKKGDDLVIYKGKVYRGVAAKAGEAVCIGCAFLAEGSCTVKDTSLCEGADRMELIG